MQKNRWILLLCLLSGCANYSASNTDTDTYNDTSTSEKLMTVDVGAHKVACFGVGPMQCLVVDDLLFYSKIQGFNFEEGYNYQLKIKRITVFTQYTVPADASLYEYHLIKVLSKTKQMSLLINEKI
ncbi:hypothetical protein PCNPT3_04790 [Psychromonas sp. CNPT3]|uniref:DUF4377 domain-containing protein n=1 Tax=Psychromonas sp. CNPT3 TaxID=314282 RepID=UPI00006E4290|nr:DUF4377 domain-containing protein [Psychromonas sp. CNPT3]AGH80900.1 hypothetical protein PCNPT3_04790 [Psychromonas sp. CNPT3]